MRGKRSDPEQGSKKEIPKEELYPNSTQFPNLLLDEIWPFLTPSEAMVLAVAVRRTLGWQKREDMISLAQFCEATGLGRRTVQKALRALKTVNLVIDLRWQPDGKMYTLNIWDDLEYGSIKIGMLRSRKEQRERSARIQTKKATEKQSSLRTIESTLNVLKDVERPGGKDVERTRGVVVERTTQNLIKHTIKHKGAEKRHPDHQRLMALYREAIREDEGKEKGKELSAPAKENKAAQKILEMGFTPEQAMECYRHFKEEPFWRGKHLSLAYIAEHIGAWKKETKREEPQRDYYGSHLDPKD